MRNWGSQLLVKTTDGIVIHTVKFLKSNKLVNTGGSHSKSFSLILVDHQQSKAVNLLAILDCLPEDSDGEQKEPQ